MLLDLGYSGTVGSVSGLYGPRTTPGATGRVHVLRTPDDAPTDANACGGEDRELLPGRWVVGPCNKEGRCAGLGAGAGWGVQGGHSLGLAAC